MHFANFETTYLEQHNFSSLQTTNLYAQYLIHIGRVQYELTESNYVINQDINCTVQYQQGKANHSDYLSRYDKPLSSFHEEEQNQMDDLHKLLYLLHMTPIINHLSIPSIATCTKEDPTLAQLLKIVKSGKTWIQKSSSIKLKMFEPTLSKITMTDNSILLKSESIILPEKLQQKAIELAHKGSQQGKSQMER